MSSAPATAAGGNRTVLEIQGDFKIPQVIAASAVGTMIEWYDFYIFGSLAAVLATQFYPKGNPTAALLSTLATFAAGFAARPFGALFFGRIGDIIGRKYAFLVTLLAISLFIRLRLRESPLFAQLKDAGQTSTAPVVESFGSKAKWQTLLLVLWGAAAGQAVVWYTGQFYALSWLQGAGTAKVPFVD